MVSRKGMGEWEALLVLVAVLFLFLAKIQPQQQPSPAPKYDISLAVSGNPGPEDEFNPLTVVYKKWAPYATKVLAFINYMHPRNKEEIQGALQIPEKQLTGLLAALEKCDLVRYDSLKGYSITFAVFDDDVWKAFDPIMRSLVSEISQRINDDILPELKAEYNKSGLEARGFPFHILGTIVIGAFGLDEYAIEELINQNFIKIRKPQPGERDYMVLAWNTKNKTRYPIWGIHGTTWNKVYFGVFGENSVMNARKKEVRALPDVVWNWQSASEKTSMDIDTLLAFLSNIVQRFGNNLFSLNDMSGIASVEKSKAMLEEWASVSLIEEQAKSRWRVSIPVLPERPFESVLKEIAQIVLKIMKEHYSSFEEPYKRTTPFSHGVPLTDVLDLVYHTTYSLSFNEILARNPELTFLKVDGPLRYTGYAILR